MPLFLKSIGEEKADMPAEQVVVYSSGKVLWKQDLSAVENEVRPQIEPVSPMILVDGFMVPYGGKL